MAKVTTSPLIEQIGQKIGGICFQRVSGGTSVRSLKTKSQTAPAASQSFKERYRILLDAWQHTLSPTDRSDWQSVALSNPIKDIFNNDVSLSGWSFFMKLNMPLLSAGNTLQVSPPGGLTVTTPLTFAASGNHTAPNIQIDSVTPTLASTEKIVIGCRPFIKPSWGRVPARLPQIATSAANPSFPFDFTTQYLNKHGLLPLGMCVGLTLHIVNAANGVYSTRLYSTVTIT